MKKISVIALLFLYYTISAQTQKPVLHAKHWLAITGKPLAATSGAMMFQKGGNAVDAACAMLASTCTMWDVLSWGGETQAIIYNPKTKKVFAINALGVAPQKATAEFYKSKGYQFPPEYGPLAAVTPGTPGGLMYMLAEYGKLSLKDVLQPAMELAAGYPIDAQTANTIERSKARIKQWPYSKKVLLPHLKNDVADQKDSYQLNSRNVMANNNTNREAPEAGEIFVQKDLLNTLQKLVDAEAEALKKKKSRKEAIYAAFNRFYKGDIADEIVKGNNEQGGLFSKSDLANWKPIEEATLSVNYKGIEVHKLQQWTQGPMMLQALNILENFNLKEMGYNSAQYIHTITQAMQMSFADRDFYYGDPYFEPKEPITGLLSKEYAKQRAQQMLKDKNDINTKPGDPYPFNTEGEKINPYLNLINNNNYLGVNTLNDNDYNQNLWAGTTSIEAADEEGWVVSVTPSGGWLPACIAGNTGIGMSQRLQSFVLDEKINPFNVLAPGKRPRVTLTPTLCMKNGKPFLAMAVQGGDTQDQNLLQFFLNIVEFGMNVQEAAEAANVNTNQLWLSLGGEKISDRKPKIGSLYINDKTPGWVQSELRKMGYTLQLDDRTSGPINAIYFDTQHNSFWGGSSNHGEDYGIGW